MDRVKTAAPEYSIKGKYLRHKILRCDPGPGHYETSHSYSNVTNGVSMKGRPATTHVECSPGPGDYQSKLLSTNDLLLISQQMKVGQ